MRNKFFKFRKIVALTLSMLMLVGMIPMSASAASFGDTSGHWAEPVIDKWASYGIVQGDDAGFRPNDSIKRGEFAVIVDRIMQYKTKAANVFADLPATEWYTDAALKLNAAGAMNGVGDASFDPTGFVTRQQAMVILARIFKVTPDSTSLYAFTDADQVASWAFAELGGMVKAGYVQGDNGKISPNANLTRAQAVQLFENIIKGFYNEAGTYSVTTDGVVIVNTPDVILQNSSAGKLFITPGVGSGDFTLSKSTVKQLVVQGGGQNSITIEDSEVESLSVGVDSSTGALRVHSAGATTIGTADVQSTSETITFTGDVGVIEVAAGSTVVVEGNVTSLTVIGENVTVIVAETASVSSLDVQGSGASLDVSGKVETASVTGGEAKVTLNETAAVNSLAVEGGNASLDVAGKVAAMDIKGGNTTVETKSTAQIDTVTINADNASIGGTGKVPEIKVEGGSGTAVKTEGSKVEVNENAGSVTTGDNAQIDPGTSGDSKGDTQQAGTGGGGTGDSSDSSSDSSSSNNNNTGGGIYVPPAPTPAPATIVYDDNVADVAALIVMAQEQLAGTYVSELIIEIDKPLDAILDISSANFPGTKPVTVKDTQKDIVNTFGIKITRDKVTIDGLKFNIINVANLVTFSNNRGAIVVMAKEWRTVTIKNCNVTVAATHPTYKIMGIELLYGDDTSDHASGETLCSVTVTDNTVVVTNSGTAHRSYALAMNGFRNATITGNDFTAERALCIDWRNAPVLSNMNISGNNLRINESLPYNSGKADAKGAIWLSFEDSKMPYTDFSIKATAEPFTTRNTCAAIDALILSLLNQLKANTTVATNVDLATVRALGVTAVSLSEDRGERYTTKLASGEITKAAVITEVCGRDTAAVDTAANWKDLAARSRLLAFVGKTENKVSGTVKGGASNASTRATGDLDTTYTDENLKADLNAALFDGQGTITDAQLQIYRALLLASNANDWAGLKPDLQIGEVTVTLSGEYAAGDTNRYTITATAIGSGSASGSSINYEIKSDAPATLSASPYGAGTGARPATDTNVLDGGWDFDITGNSTTWGTSNSNDYKSYYVTDANALSVSSSSATLIDRTVVVHYGLRAMSGDTHAGIDTPYYRANHTGEGLTYTSEKINNTHFKYPMTRVYAAIGTYRTTGTTMTYVSVPANQTYVAVYIGSGNAIIGYTVTNVSVTQASQ